MARARLPVLRQAAGPLALAVIALALGAPASLRAVAPGQRWRTLRTRCCDVHFPARLEGLARRAAPLLDEADRKLFTLLGARPRDRVQAVLEDETDNANGWALTVPYNTIHLYAAAPADLSPLGDSEDWLRQLIIHEYAHIVHLDTLSGVPELLQKIIGKHWAPNQVQPPWFVEGLAVYAESRLSNGGRARAALHSMSLRAAALEDKLWTLDQISSGRQRYPWGEARYLYGGRFLSYLARRYGDAALAQISARYGAQLMPYGLNRAAHNTLEASYDRLFADFLDEVRQQARAVASKVEARGGDHSRRLTTLGDAVARPQWTPDGDLVFYASPRVNTPGLYLYEVQAQRARRLVELHGDGGLAVLDNDRVLLSQPEVFADYYVFRDLYLQDLHGGQARRLTHGLRARDPLLRDAKRVVFVRVDGATCALSQLDLRSGAVEDLLRFDDGTQIYTPVLAPDGQHVVVSLWRAGGTRDLWLIDLDQASMRPLTQDRALDLHPRFSSDKRHILFSSDRDGVFNIYALSLQDGRVWQVSNVATGAFWPTPSADGRRLYFVGFGAEGYDLRVLDAADVLGLAAESSYHRPLAHLAEAASRARVEPYNPVPTLLPHAWLPVVESSGRELRLGLALSGRDAVGLHRYALQVSTALPSTALRLDAGYAYDDLPVPLRLTLRQNQTQQGLRLDAQRQAEVTVQSYQAELLAVLPRVRWFSALSLGLGVALGWTGRLQALDFEPDSAPPRLPWTGRTAALRVYASYRDTRRFRDSISPERGLAFGVSLRAAQPWLGSEAEFVEFSGNVQGYLPVPGLPRHVVALLLQGGHAWGPRAQRRVFALGGIADRNLVDDTMLGVRLGTGYLRGYPTNAFVGDGALVLSLEYRLPLFRLERGLSTLPIFAQRFDAAFFADAGGTYLDAPSLQSFLHRSLGAELRVVLKLGYVMPVELRLGLARGFDRGGLDVQTYAVLGSNY